MSPSNPSVWMLNIDGPLGVLIENPNYLEANRPRIALQQYKW